MTLFFEGKRRKGSLSVTTNHRWLLLPGLGADARLLDPQREVISDLFTPEWIEPRQSESLADYAARFLRTFPLPLPEIFGGVSLGGMIALEMARVCQPKAVVLISSCQTGRAIFGPGRVCRFLVPLVPRFTIRLAQWSASVAETRLGASMLQGTTLEQRRLCVDMFRRSSPKFVLWGLRAILDWNPEPLENVPIWHIHGGRDRPIPVRNVKPGEILPEGSHLMNLSLPRQVNDFLLRVDRSV
jgi:pimeloyl-ACP methyl ester carboxylesterase